MGIFDRLIAQAPCPFCGLLQSWHVQFKYGACWLNDHHVGDMISRSDTPRWNEPRPVPGRVRVPGIAEESCSACGAEEVWAAIAVDDDRITGISLLRDEPREDERGVIEEPIG